MVRPSTALLETFFLVFAAASAFLGVLLGAFGAHGLRHQVSADMLAAWQTAVQYQMLHSLAILLLVLLQRNGMCRMAGACSGMALGILLFSGSLYLLVLTGNGGLGMVTPLGGTGFLLGWLALMISAWRHRKSA